MCLQLRGKHSSHAGTWGFWGGKANPHEKPMQTLLRELREEIGLLPDFEGVYHLNKFTSEDKRFQYFAYVVTVFEEFIPQTNRESAGFSWTTVDSVPKPLHQGAKLVLNNKKHVDIINSYYESKKDSTNLPNWLDSF